jgi:AcrR family transcriptional regulator
VEKDRKSDGKTRFDRRKEQTRAALQTAAQGLILTKGFSVVTIDDIVQKADVARGTFYLHYRDKEALVWDIVQAHLDELDAEQPQGAPAQPVTRAQKLAGLTAAFERAARHRKLYLLVLGPNGSAAVANRFQQHLAAETERGIAAGRFHSGGRVPVPIQAQFFAGAISRLFVWWLESGGELSAEAMGELTLEMLAGPTAGHRVPDPPTPAARKSR